MRWYQHALWEEGKPVEAVWCFGQCAAGKPWVLPSITMLIWHVPPTKALLQTMYTLLWKWYSLMAVASFSRIMHHASKQKWLRNGLRCWFGHQISKFSVQLGILGCSGQTSPVNGGPVSQLSGLKGSDANVLALDTVMVRLNFRHKCRHTHTQEAENR